MDAVAQLLDPPCAPLLAIAVNLPVSISCRAGVWPQSLPWVGTGDVFALEPDEAPAPGCSWRGRALYDAAFVA
jgi:hypothetical protein